ncbi:MAG TPA: ABC transporter permease [Chloroflexia bacterium]|jgi:putative ABC transport system permease protein
MATLESTLTAARPQEREQEDLEGGGISLWETLRMSFATLMANKLRTVLTALGVIIGVASVVALLAIGRGTQEQITERITANGANLLTVRSSGAAGGGDARLTMDDAEALADPANVPDAAKVSPESMGISSVVAGSESKTTMVLGVTSSYLELHNNKLQYGEFIGDGMESSNVVVLGARAAKDLFGEGADPTGATIRIKGQTFKVIGVLASKGASVFGFDDDAVLVPLQVAQRKLFNSRVAGAGGKLSVSNIVVQAKDKNSIERVKSQIEATLREQHKLPAYGGADDFTIDNQEDLINTVTETSRTMTLYLGAIAAISLVVGGIGIMNIMLVSVRERTREIGLRKAIGARERDILTQFLMEALLLSTTGGLIGLAIGALIAVVANESGQTRALVSPESVLLAVGFAMTVGLFFGIEPARRAAKLDPIEALRYE